MPCGTLPRDFFNLSLCDADSSISSEGGPGLSFHSQYPYLSTFSSFTTSGIELDLRWYRLFVERVLCPAAGQILSMSRSAK